MKDAIAHRDFLKVRSIVYDKCGFQCGAIKLEEESLEYGAAKFKLNDLNINVRTAKITPKKIGQFVAIWKRNKQGVTVPPNKADSFDLLVINVQQNDLSGQFVFPKSILLKKGIVAGEGSKGKNGIRVYPAWDKAVNKQAVKTQEWQLKYFLETSESKDIDLNKVKDLYLNFKNTL